MEDYDVIQEFLGRSANESTPPTFFIISNVLIIRPKTYNYTHFFHDNQIWRWKKLLLRKLSFSLEFISEEDFFYYFSTVMPKNLLMRIAALNCRANNIGMWILNRSFLLYFVFSGNFFNNKTGPLARLVQRVDLNKRTVTTHSDS